MGPPACHVSRWTRTAGLQAGTVLASAYDVLSFCPMAENSAEAGDGRGRLGVWGGESASGVRPGGVGRGGRLSMRHEANTQTETTTSMHRSPD